VGGTGEGLRRGGIGGRERGEAERDPLTVASDTGVTPAQLQMELKQVREVVDHLQEKVRLFAPRSQLHLLAASLL
jgi:hypothetical protein